MLMPHAIEDCPQNPTLAHIQSTLERLDKHGERTAAALESIARQGAILGSHEKRLDKHDMDLREFFNRVNDERKLNLLTLELKDVAARVTSLEMAHAKEAGEEIVETKIQMRREGDERERKKFWTELKIRMITPIMFGLFFALWLIDKWNLVLKFKELLKDFRG